MRGFYSNNNKPYQSSSGQAVDDSIHLTEFNGILAIMDEEEEEEECYKEEKLFGITRSRRVLFRGPNPEGSILVSTRESQFWAQSSSVPYSV